MDEKGYIDRAFITALSFREGTSVLPPLYLFLAPAQGLKIPLL